VKHTPVIPAYGYRFDYRGRSVVVSGDTVKDADLIAVAKGADVLVHEAQANHLVAMMREEAEKTGRTRIAKILVTSQPITRRPFKRPRPPTRRG